MICNLHVLEREKVREDLGSTEPLPLSTEILTLIKVRKVKNSALYNQPNKQNPRLVWREMIHDEEPVPCEVEVVGVKLRAKAWN